MTEPKLMWPLRPGPGAIRVQVGATAETLVFGAVADRDYWMGGGLTDGTAGNGDVLLLLQATLLTHSLITVCVIDFDDADHVRITVDALASLTLLWDDGATTVDGALFGWTASSVPTPPLNVAVGDTRPLGVWLPGILASRDSLPEPQFVGGIAHAVNGATQVADFGLSAHTRTLEWDYVERRRAQAVYADDGPGQAFSTALLAAWGRGRRLRYHPDKTSLDGVQYVPDWRQTPIQRAARAPELYWRVKLDLTEDTVTPIPVPTGFTSALRLSLDGVSDYVNAGDVALLDGTAAFTLSMRLRVDVWGSLDYVFSRYVGTNRQLLIQQVSTGKLRITLGTGPSTTVLYDFTNVELVAGTEAHVAFVFSAGTLAVYVDGASVPLTGAGAPASLLSIGPQDAIMGRHPNVASGFAAISLREVGLWASAATLAQVGEMYAGGTPPDLDTLATMPAPGRYWRPELSTLPTLVDVHGADATVIGGIIA